MNKKNSKLTAIKRIAAKNKKADANSLPDVQNADITAIKGANVPIAQVGVHNFKLPLKFLSRAGDVRELETSVWGTVSLGANAKGINMSRIMRTFYIFSDEVFTLNTLDLILRKMKSEVETQSANLKLSFSYPIMQTSLRSKLKGWQYYKCAYEAHIDKSGKIKSLMHFDFIYSSACPCSAELADHACANHDIYGIPHSQRSKARISVSLSKNAKIFIEDLQEHCAKALRTETQVMVKREDEQAFAELNGEYVKFVEDAARLIFAELNSDKRIADFQAACIHLESLHSHDAVSVICKGVENGFDASFSNFSDLIC